jgi:hypothetical protein
LTSWSLANINIPFIPCTGSPSWYRNYLDQIHQFEAGETYQLTVTAGYSSTHFAVWIDWNDNLDLAPEELILTGICTNANTPYTFDITIPEMVSRGTHIMRARTNWQNPATDPCATYSWGNCMDFKANIEGGINWLTVDPLAGAIAPGDNQTLSVTFNSEDLELGSYTASILISSNDPYQSQLSIPVILDVVEELESFYNPVWTVPFNPMTFYILEANIDQAPMQPGDEVGLFDVDPNSGEQICVGAGILIEQLGGGVFLEVIASMDDGANPTQANGFTAGNPILYRLWSQEIGEIVTVTAGYPYPGYDEVYTAQGSTMVELNGFTSFVQEIQLQTGWNLMSFRVMPENWDMLNIVQPLIDQGVLFKALDGVGGSIFHLPFPPPNGQWTNTIGDMKNAEGYYIKVTDNAAFTLEGGLVETPMEIPLYNGWNIMSYPCEHQQNALDVVQPLINAGILFKVIDEAGGSVFHLPFPPPNGQWTNTIGNFHSGKGYYIKVTADATLTVSEPVKAAEPMPPSQTKETQFFQPAWQNNPFMPMHIVIQPNDHLKTGDEVGIFDGDICVGAAAFDGSTSTPFIITTSLDDPDTEIMDGFVSGNEINLMVWDSSTGEMLPAAFEVLIGNGKFDPLGTMVSELFDPYTDVPELLSNELNLKAMPNPFDEQIQLFFTLPQAGIVKIEWFNMPGTKVHPGIEQYMTKGNHNLTFSLPEFNKGVYLLQLTFFNAGDQINISQKIIKR